MFDFSEYIPDFFEGRTRNTWVIIQICEQLQWMWVVCPIINKIDSSWRVSIHSFRQNPAPSCGANQILRFQIQSQEGGIYVEILKQIFHTILKRNVLNGFEQLKSV